MIIKSALNQKYCNKAYRDKYDEQYRPRALYLDSVLIIMMYSKYIYVIYIDQKRSSG